MELDGLDKKILNYLEKDSRVSYTTLEKKLGISDVAVKKRIDKLINQGVIERFSILIDHKKIGMPLKAFILLKSIPSETAQINAELEKLENIVKISSTIGSFDLLIELICKDIEELKMITDESMGNLKGVTDIRTLVVV